MSQNLQKQSPKLRVKQRYRVLGFFFFFFVFLSPQVVKQVAERDN